MNKIPKTFAIYCSEGASRVIKFYSFEENLVNYKPQKVIYDGERFNIINTLQNLFGEDLIILDKSSKLFNPKRIHNSTSEFIETKLIEYSIDYLLCFGDKILKKSLIDKFSKRLINFHPALLPSFKGLLSINQAFDYGVSIIGNTAHFIDEGIDTGKIILQTAMLNEDFDDYEDVLEMQFPMIKMILRDVLYYDIKQTDIMKELSNRNKRLLIPKKCKL
jgi:phosphoribosylglycinamide formyltransferase-1|tara:strand:+ start:57 stop:713 length:657 start_codon:yes stop_codon:yes gene_type:complete